MADALSNFGSEFGADLAELLKLLTKATEGNQPGQYDFFKAACAFMNKLEGNLRKANSVLLQLEAQSEPFLVGFSQEQAQAFIEREKTLIDKLKLEKADRYEFDQRIRAIVAKGLPAEPLRAAEVLDAIERMRELLCRAEEFTKKQGLSGALLKLIRPHVFDVGVIVADVIAAVVTTAVAPLALIGVGLAAICSVGAATKSILKDVPATKEELDTYIQTQKRLAAVKEHAVKFVPKKKG